jgi:hypothetical protein
MEYSVSLQPLRPGSKILRVHPGHGVYSDPYVWFTVVEPHGTDALIQGALEAPPQEAMGPIEAAVREAGFRRRIYERIRNGTVRQITRDLT